jgi:hypothetical protein
MKNLLLRAALQQAWDASPTLPPIMFDSEEADALIAAIISQSRKGGLGWDADGLCDDHNRFGCRECAIIATTAGVSVPLIDRPCRAGCNNPKCCPVKCCHPLPAPDADRLGGAAV